MISEKTLESLKQVLTESNYTAAICGSGMMEEGGILELRQEGRAYETEQKYSESPEELFHISCLFRRPERFYEFYREEILKEIPDMTPSAKTLARMEEGDKLQCIITTNVFDLPEQMGCRNVVCPHESIYKNRYPHCGRLYSVEEIRNSRYVPYCKSCKTMIRPGTSLYGEMVDSSITSRTTEEIARVDVLLVLETSLRPEVHSNYVRYFQDKKMAATHRIPRPLDEKVDMVIYDFPQNVPPSLVDGGI